LRVRVDPLSPLSPTNYRKVDYEWPGDLLKNFGVDPGDLVKSLRGRLGL
jgi:hypothetical protein